MSDTHDTIDGLLAEFRGYAAGMPPSYHVTMSWYDFRRMLDRLEAAHKRELGDVAKLREAMKHIKDRLPHMLQYMRVHWEDASAGGYFDELMLVIDGALAAPPRNCDIAQDWLRDLYVKFKPPASVKREMPPEWVDAVMAFCRWLVAPAKEGGRDGGK